MEQKQFVLAMYDVRGKQDFIYRSRKCKEIVGGSHIIADVFKEYLYPAAKKLGGEIYTYSKGEAFSCAAFVKRMEQGKYFGEVVYEGGGNFLVLYRDADTAVCVNRLFTRELLIKTGTLKVLCTMIGQLDFDDYRKDQRRLYEKHRINEAQESVIFPVNTIPFVQVSPNTGRPFSDRIILGGESRMVTREQKAKYQKYEEYLSGLQGEAYESEAFLLDELVTEKGKESLLAVIYIDGNSMGAKVERCLEGRRTYDECVTELRRFSEEIDRVYVRERLQAVQKTLAEKYAGKKERNRRTIVSAGDEMTIICNARDALDLVKAYFSGLPEGSSSCAGIAVFHSHAPYSDAYRIAEECCENGKKLIKKAEAADAAGVRKADISLVDFHYCQGAIGSSLENIREREGLTELLSKPWRIERRGEDGEILLSPVYQAEDLLKEDRSDKVSGLAELFNCLGHGNVKELRRASQMGSAELEMELERIKAHSSSPLDFTVGGTLTGEERRKLIYDVAVMYDLWFWEAAK